MQHKIPDGFQDARFPHRPRDEGCVLADGAPGRAQKIASHGYNEYDDFDAVDADGYNQYESYAMRRAPQQSTAPMTQ